MRLTRRQVALSGTVTAVPDGLAGASETEVNSDPAEIARRCVSALYEERGEEFLHYALALGRDEELAKDAVQEAFMRYFVALYGGDHIASPRAWVYRVMHNYLLDRIKARRNRDEHPLSNAQNCRQAVNLENDCFRKEIFQHVQSKLTTREYDCFRLRSEGLQYNEIAAKLDLTSGTVGTLIGRAVQKLRTLLVPRKEGRR